MHSLKSQHTMARIKGDSMAVAAITLFCVLHLPQPAHAHAKGLYKTQAEAEQRAKELGCKGTHQNNGLWMPCAHEAMLHQELRKE